MEEFINRFCSIHRHGPPKFLAKQEALFNSTIAAAEKGLGVAAFRPTRSMNAAAFDSIAIGIARRLENGPILDSAGLKRAYETLLKNDDYLAATTRATADEANVANRLKFAIQAFVAVK